MTITTEINGAVATVTINRPEKMNALTAEMREGLIAAFEKIRFDSAIRAVILTGAGTSFCAGADVDKMAGRDTGLPAGRARGGPGPPRAGSPSGLSAYQTLSVISNVRRYDS